MSLAATQVGGAAKPVAGRSLARTMMLHAVAIALTLGLWQFVVAIGLARELVVSTPLRVAAEFFAVVVSPRTWSAVLVTIGELVAGLLIGGAVGVVLGAAFARVPLLDRMFKPLVLALYTLPRLALLPLFVVWLGLGVESKIAVAVIHGVVLFMLGAYAAVSSIDTKLIEACRLFGASRLRLLALVYVPSSVPYLLTTVRQAIGLALGSVIVAEMTGAFAGMGFELSRRLAQFDMTGVLAWVVLASMLGLALERVALTFERRLTRWTPRQQDD
ncbi:MAG TPA: ABC transporter permease [Rhizobiaceae bacterium]|nr:ABC transporter permease [Rhizobiaceae bacterium]